MKLGIHAYAWTSQWTNDTLGLIDRVKDLGLDFIEIPLMVLDTFDAAKIKERLDGVGLGATSFSGVIYSKHVRALESKPAEKHWEYSAKSLKIVARLAKDLGVLIGLEPVNRYETFLVNTCDQALKLKDMIGEDNVKIHLDTYHMNIEEKSFYDATLKAGQDLIHYHLCENAALESFVDTTENMNTWVWRQLAPDGDTLLKEGVAFIRSKQKEYGLG